MHPQTSSLLLAGTIALCASIPAQAAGATKSDYAALLTEMRKLNERVEKLEIRNRDLEKQLVTNGATEKRLQTLEEANQQLETALTSERLSDKEPELATRLKALETQTLSMQKQARQVEALTGISVGANLTGVVQGVNGGGSASGSRETRSNYRGDIAVSLPGGDIGNAEGKIFAHLRLGQGNGLGLVPTYTSTVNSTAFQVGAIADDSFAILAQAWYQVKIPLPLGGYKPNSREHLQVTLGKIDPFVFFDQNGAADDETTKFLNNAFVHNPLLDSGGDVGADRYGFSPGAIVSYTNEKSKPESWGASLGVFSAGNGANFSGSSGHPFVIAQLESAQRYGNLPGNYRFYAWNNAQGADYDSVTATGHSGIGASVDQRVGDATTLFARYGHQIKGRTRFDRAATFGGELAGNDWGRGADSVGIAAGFLRTSSEFRDDSLTVDANSDGIADYGYEARGWERIAEIYYRFHLNKQLELTPDFQYIANPGGNEAASSVRVLGLRARVSY